MRNLKKFLALVLAMMMAFSLMVTANATNAKTDYPDMDAVLDEFEEAVDVLSGMGVFRGNNGNFLPQNKIMRSEAVAVLYRLVTGDVGDTQANLYSPLATSFKDVKETDWFAGYVGWAVDAGLINGYDGNFMPYKNVTGYEMLKMLLKAVGYGKNGEFVGNTWRVNVGSTAESLGILKNIQSTHYANTLAQFSAREVVAELTFQTAAYVPTVRYELGYYNPYIGVASAQGGNIKNPTLGEIKFGLKGQTGIVVGNQATGEDNTLLGVNVTATWNPANGGSVSAMTLGQSGSYVYATDTTTAFDATHLTANATLELGIKTGLDLFGHKATVWYNSNTSKGTQDVGTNGLPVGKGFSTVYAVADKATKTGYVYAEDGNLADSSELAGAVEAAGFKRSSAKQAHFSNRYSQMSAAQGNATDNSGTVSPISTYALISNSGETVDVVIALSAEVAKITQKNTTAKDPYVVLGYSGGDGNGTSSGTGNSSTFGNGTAGTILEKKLTAASVKDLGKLVIAEVVVGTKGVAFGDTSGRENNADTMFELKAPETFTATVRSYKYASGATIDSVTPVVGEVNLVGRDKAVKLSGITRGDATNSEIISKALPVVDSLNATATYTVYVDKVGRFISLTTDSDYKFLYGTFADFETGALGAGTIAYSMVGVDWDGQKLTNNALKSWNNISMTGQIYKDDIDVTKKDFGTAVGNEINGGEDTGYWYNATSGDLQPYTGTGMVDGDSWPIASSDAANGFVKVTSNLTDYLLTKDTQFIVVSGTGTATLEVNQYKGLADFLQGAADATISYTDGDNHVYFQTEAKEYGTVDTANNGVITKVILSDGNVNRWNSTSMFFNYEAQVGGTGLVLPGATGVNQYALWCNGELGYYFVKDSAGVAPDDANTFYNLVKIDEQGGVDIYRATTAPVNSGTGDLTGAGYASNDITYKYITVSTLDTGLFEDASDSSLQKVMKIAGANLCDVEYKTDNSTGRNEIKTLTELNNAVSVQNADGTTAVYGIGVAIVYDGINVATIYVTNVT